VRQVGAITGASYGKEVSKKEIDEQEIDEQEISGEAGSAKARRGEA
jgi:hypothetical protein